MLVERDRVRIRLDAELGAPAVDGVGAQPREQGVADAGPDVLGGDEQHVGVTDAVRVRTGDARHADHLAVGFGDHDDT
jgi:hypothetical protein